jgi:hypothetical protein
MACSGGPHNLSPPPLLIGDSWVQHFFNRHPELETQIGRTIEAARLKEVSKAAIKKYNIESENMYNMDETGFAFGFIQAAQVVINKSLKTNRQACPGR